MHETWAVIDNGIVAEARDAHLPAPWWSFTKTILSAAALVLVRDGVLALDEPLPDKPYTLRRLLQHRSGLANYGGFPAYHEAVAQGDELWPVPALLLVMGLGTPRARGGSIPTSAISSCGD